MAYAVKEARFTLQGEGAQAGRVVVLCRFAGCNLWSGKVDDRASAACWFCDTDFSGTNGPGGGRFESPRRLAMHLRAIWDRETSDAPVSRQPSTSAGIPCVIFTGGEPLLQLDGPLLSACRALGMQTGVETNGTLLVPDGLDWVCVSPKPGNPLRQRHGNELKLLFPLPTLNPPDFLHLDFQYFFLQPLDVPGHEEHIWQAMEYCLAHPRWRLSVQIHKILGIP